MCLHLYKQLQSSYTGKYQLPNTAHCLAVLCVCCIRCLIEDFRVVGLSIMFPSLDDGFAPSPAMAVKFY